MTQAVPPPWDATVVSGDICADPARLRLAGPGFAAYVSSGQTVAITAKDLPTRMAYDHVVYGWALRWLLFQRGRMCLRAPAAVNLRGKAVAFIGAPGSGKTTTAINLVHRGWQLACDDASEVDGTALKAHDRPVHLSREAILSMGGTTAVGRPVPDSDRFAVRVPLAAGDWPLEAVVEIAVGPDLRVRRLTPVEAISRIASLSIPEVGLAPPEIRQSLLDWSASIAESVPAFRVQRPRTGLSPQGVAKVVDQLLV